MIAIFALVFSGIRNGLLSAPDMGVEGIGSGNGTFTWFQDQTAGVLDTPAVYLGADVELPAAVLRVGRLDGLRAGRWLRWAFNAWKTNGLWRTE